MYCSFIVSCFNICHQYIHLRQAKKSRSMWCDKTYTLCAHSSKSINSCNMKHRERFLLHDGANIKPLFIRPSICSDKTWCWPIHVILLSTKGVWYQACSLYHAMTRWLCFKYSPCSVQFVLCLFCSDWQKHKVSESILQFKMVFTVNLMSSLLSFIRK